MAIANNPLFDLDFLKELLEEQQRILYARITSLTWDEKPIEYIEGQVTGGSINIDGKSIVRRTCSISLVAKDLNITDFYWGLKTKFKLEVGISNKINKNYPDVIWFKQGIYVINTFNTSKSTSGYTVTINGKDKMCLLNGTLGGAMVHTTDFGIEEYYDSEANTTTYTSIPIKTIIREAIQNFCNELPQNIIINDIDDTGVELLEYRGDIPLFLLKNIETDVISNMTINTNQPCFYNGQEITIDNLPYYDSLVELDDNIEGPTVITLTEDGDTKYTVVKVEYGDTPGYRLTDLTYAGDLILNVGENITALLDKIVNMLGNFEYFYNLDGKFVFQKKKIYTSIPWLNSESGEELPTSETEPMWSFLNGQLVSSYQNTPNLTNLRNDFSVWGKKKTTSGSELDIHMRYAIDNKPQSYHSLIDNLDYTIENWDWRELIYRMALDYRKYYHDDDFLLRVAAANPQYPTGRTGYEQYYIDLEGFWRLLYNPVPEPYYQLITNSSILEDVQVRYAVRPILIEELNAGIDYSTLFIKKDGEVKPFLGGYCYLDEDTEYGYLTTSATIDLTKNTEILNSLSLDKIYIATENFYVIDKENGNEQQFMSEERDKEGNPIAAYFLVPVLSYKEEIRKYNKYIKITDYSFKKLKEELQQGKVSAFIQETDAEKYYSLNELKDLEEYYILDDSLFSVGSYDNYNNKNDDNNSYKVEYYNRYYNYNLKTYWHNDVQNAPESLLFWFDFLEANTSEIGKYSVPVLGDRTKAINDNDVKSIYYKEVPKVLFQSGEELYEHETGYTYIQLQDTMENLFTISSRGKSAKSRIEELLQDCAYCAESISLTVLPIYHLEPGHRIVVLDEDSQINGEYLVDKITIPLTYNGTMNITATKVVSDLM